MSFRHWQGSHAFNLPTARQGYLAQINDWAQRSNLRWEVERIGGEDHTPQWQVIPIYNGQPLYECMVIGRSIKKAKKEAETAAIAAGYSTRWHLDWQIETVRGPAHLPSIRACPIVNGMMLIEHARTGNSKQAAKEASARAMAESGHCVCLYSFSCVVIRSNTEFFNSL
ncbi:hypothetical protein K474DRAFT_1657060 [Panus rudis PR-1116 ss-1]|nr:hypothetical protein K474DRAFT_1657060 [Panus rudis PR-1116 ss-1]